MINFTIVIPVHNGMPYIKECLESALNQDYKNYNIIVLENMSNDGTVEYIESLNSDIISIVKSDKLLDINENWSRIKDLEMNEYMTILMADDKLEPNYLSLITELIKKHPNCNSFRSNISLINENGEVFHKSRIKEKITIHDYLEGRLKHTYTETAAGYTFKTQRYKEIGGIDCKFGLMHTDDKLFMEIIGENNFMAVAKKHAAYYRCHEKSESRVSAFDNAIGGYNYWLNWIYNLNDSKLRNIVKYYLPYHLKQISHFYSQEEIENHKEIYKIYNINDKDILHKWINYNIKHKPSPAKFLSYIFSVKNDYRNNIKRKVIRILGIKMAFKCDKKGVN